MKILHVYKTFLGDTIGGIEQVIAQIVQGNQSEHFQHTILSVSQNPQPKVWDYCGVNNIRFQESLNLASNSISFSLFKDFPKIAQQNDIIHYHFPWPFADILHLFWKIKKPSLLTYHSDIIRQKNLLYVYQPIMNYFLKKVDGIIATSPNYLATSSVLQNYKEKVTVIPIGLDKTSYQSPSPERKRYWQQLFGNQFFLFVGVMRYYKGLHILLDAAQQTPFPILLIGTGPIEKELKERAKAMKITNVHFLGRLAEEDKIALLELCLAVVFPSNLRSEAFGVSLLEGAMYSKPMISSEIGTGTSYINVEGETGVVVPPGDAIALRNAMQFLWDNPEKRAAMGKQAAARYQQLFTAEKMVAAYKEAYYAVVSQKQALSQAPCSSRYS